MKGFHGNYLRIDLASAQAEAIGLSETVSQAYLGGIGLGCWMLLEESPPGNYEALSPEAPLVFGFSLLAGTDLNTSAKAAVISKSPLSGRINDAMISSGFALAGKGVGSDGLVVKGACADWSVLFVSPEGIELQPAGEFLGLSAEHTEAAIRGKWGEAWQVAAIGQAGENLVPFSVISHDGRHAGRGGGGAVMGSKKLKAIAVKGGKPTTIANETELRTIGSQLKKKSLGPATEKYRTTGTLGNLSVFNRLSILPTKNFSETEHKDAHALSAEQMFSEGRMSRSTCADCMIGCEKRIELKDGGTVRLEYESIFALGSLLSIWDAPTVLEASRLCDELGLDTISMGGTLAFAMECVEKELLEMAPLSQPAGDVLLEAIRKTAGREGYGKELALGSRVLANQIGGDCLDFAPQVKGLELPGYHPGRLQTLGLGLAVGARGADHNKSSAYDLDLSGRVEPRQLDEERIAEMVEIEDQAAVMDSLILCKFIRRALDDFYGESAEILTTVTGSSFAQEALEKSARRIHNLRKLFNQRQGWEISEDTLPARFYQKDQAPASGGTVNRQAFEAAREKYYLHRGWNEKGILTESAEVLNDLLLSPRKQTGLE